MGSFMCDRCQAIEIEDRARAPLQTVILDKLRRNESFAFDVLEAKHWVTVWVSQRTPLEFRYSANRRPALNRDWLELLADEVGMHGVLRLVPEPEPEPAPRPSPESRHRTLVCPSECDGHHHLQRAPLDGCSIVTPARGSAALGPRTRAGER
jgi:hypothetical protein